MTAKPRSREAMKNLIQEIRVAIPFNLPETELCAGACHGCPKKLIEFLEAELNHWDKTLKNNGVPLLGEVDKLAKTSRKIYSALQKNKII